MILFAGAIGSGKSPIANYLSYKLKLAVFSNDLIRKEVREDCRKLEPDQYQKRRQSRLKEILEGGQAFIYDASIDRRWQSERQLLADYGYHTFIISLDFSRAKLSQLWQAKGYGKLTNLARTMADHQAFKQEYSADIKLQLTDKDFSQRLELTYQAIKAATKH